MKKNYFSEYFVPPSYIPIRNKQLNRFCLFITLLLLSAPMQSLSEIMQQEIPSQSDLNWQLDKTVSGVELFYAISPCNGGNVVFLKMNNKNKYPVEVSWKEVFQTQVEKDIEGSGGEKKITLPPGETFETDCDKAKHKQLLILPGLAIPTYIARISKFNYKDVTVNKTK